MLKDKNQRFIVSHLSLRKLIGILGMLLPFACFLGGSLFQYTPVLDSISAYYHSNMRDILVGLLIGVSLFLMTYKGYERRDMLMALVSGIAGLGIAIFPCTSRVDPSLAVGVFQLGSPIAGYLHYGITDHTLYPDENSRRRAGNNGLDFCFRDRYASGIWYFVAC